MSLITPTNTENDAATGSKIYTPALLLFPVHFSSVKDNKTSPSDSFTLSYLGAIVGHWRFITGALKSRAPVLPSTSECDV